MMSSDQLLTTPAVATRLEITVRQVYELIDRGDLPIVKSDRGLVRVPASAVDKYEAHRATKER